MNLAKFMITINALIASTIGLYFFIAPAIMGIYYVQDEQIEKLEISRFAKDLHYNISADFTEWAKDRLEHPITPSIDDSNLKNERPLLSALFYLWATESLQDDYKDHPQNYDSAPKVYAKEAINTAIKLVTHPKQATWVKQQWGKDYLNQENIFYRSVLIAAMVSHHQLTRSSKYLEVMKQQALSLDNELASTTFGLANSYPDNCRPADIAFAYYAISQAKEALQLTPDSLMAQHVRGLSYYQDSSMALPDASLLLGNSVQQLEEVNGNATAWLLHFSSKLWPSQSADWMDAYKKQFWQENWGATGFRLQSVNDIQKAKNWTFSTAQGPVLAGHSLQASAFGLGACRIMGESDLAYLLSTEVILGSFPLLDGSLLLPQFLSDFSDAHLYEELALLYNLTRQPLASVIKAEQSIPIAAKIINGLLWLMGIIVIWRGIWRTKRSKEVPLKPAYISFQFLLWLGLICAAFWFFSYQNYLGAVLLVLISRLFPILTIEQKSS